MTVTLPRKAVKAESQNPRKLLIFSAPKRGKTSLLAGLKDNLNIDLEKGSIMLDMVKVEANSLEELIEIGKAIKVENEKEGKKIYNSISIDTLTKFEELAWQLALKNYKNSLIGKNFQGDINAFRQMPKGAGYPLTN